MVSLICSYVSQVQFQSDFYPYLRNEKVICNLSENFSNEVCKVDVKVTRKGNSLILQNLIL